MPPSPPCPWNTGASILCMEEAREVCLKSSTEYICKSTCSLFVKAARVTVHSVKTRTKPITAVAQHGTSSMPPQTQNTSTLRVTSWEVHTKGRHYMATHTWSKVAWKGSSITRPVAGVARPTNNNVATAAATTLGERKHFRDADTAMALSPRRCHVCLQGRTRSSSSVLRPLRPPLPELLLMLLTLLLRRSRRNASDWTSSPAMVLAFVKAKNQTPPVCPTN